ncbi:hypothetical protein F4779DRAFT_613250 [Xylariaceae sp. FL0662B]|nr:hypothetical protein F4779DRAFT_613250 [Xylariaceae sp. FL0662B]
MTEAIKPAKDTESEAASSLPAQTTPFATPTQDNMCQLSVYCTNFYYIGFSLATAASGHPLQSAKCLAVHLTSLADDPTQVGHQTSCFPDGYFILFYNEWGQLAGSSPYTNEGDSSTIVYPGGNCIHGWKTACTTTITHEGSQFPQAWCCPPGKWSCATATASADRQAPERLCQSVMTESTEVWVSFDPPYVSGTMEKYMWTVSVTIEAPEHAATVFRKVFPLALESAPSQGAAQKTAYPLRSDMLSRYVLAAVSIVIVTVSLSLLFWFGLLYRKRRRARSNAGMILKQRYV